VGSPVIGASGAGDAPSGVRLPIPAGAKVRRNHEDAQLSDLQQGDLVWVLQSGDKTLVKAVSAR
jgi:anaerobic selenocysteine-containing dehydrogenase